VAGVVDVSGGLSEWFKKSVIISDAGLMEATASIGNDNMGPDLALFLPRTDHQG
jgi:hypothetical protein